MSLFSRIRCGCHDAVESGDTQVKRIDVEECIAKRMELSFESTIVDVFRASSENRMEWFDSVFPEPCGGVFIVLVAEFDGLVQWVIVSV